MFTLSLFSFPLFSLQLPSNPHLVFETGDITPEVLENPLKNFPRLKDTEINAALSEYDKASEERPREGTGQDSTEEEGENGGVEKTASSSCLSPMR